MDPDGRGDGEELGGVKGGEIVIIYYVGGELFSIKVGGGRVFFSLEQIPG